MNYQREKELQIDLLSKDLGIITSRNCFVRTEVSVSECVPDIVYINYLSKIPNYHVDNKISSQHIFLFYLVKKNKIISFERLIEISFLRKSKVEQILNDLIRSKMVHKNINGYLEIDENISSLKTEVIAIEVKLSKWKQAFNQANRYKGFADKVIVAMDASRAPRDTKILEEFVQSNIGLCAVTPSTLEWLVSPKNISVDSFEKEYLVSSTLSHSAQTQWVRR